SFADSAKSLPGVKRVGRPKYSADGHYALIVVTPTTGPEDSASTRIVDRLRADPGPAGPPMHAATVSVGGIPAENRAFTTLVSGSLWKIFVFVLLLSYLVLLFMLRSVFLPLKAVVMNVLSVAAAYGVLVIVFQYGWTDPIINFTHLGYI